MTQFCPMFYAFLGLFRRIGHGGGIINRRILLSLLLLFGLALVLNAHTSAAADVTATNVATDQINPVVTAADVTADTADKINPVVTAVNPKNKSIILKSRPIKVTFSETIKAGSNAIELKNGKSIIPTKNSISGKTLIITPKSPLKTGIKYILILHPNSVTDMSGNGNLGYSSVFTVSPITLAQMKNGQSRTQKFYNTHHRLPHYVNFGKKKITIKNFIKIIATQGLKIKTLKVSAKNKSGTVTKYGWNSCCKGWFKTGGTFLNYCPICHCYGCLVYNPKHTAEGEWTCSKCDSDFCLCGKCKASGSKLGLTKA